MKRLVVMFVVVEEGEKPHPFDVETSDPIEVVARGRFDTRESNAALGRVMRAINREASS